CHFNTLDCGEGINQIGMHCGDVYHYEFGNELDTIACRDDDHLVPIGLPFLCANPTDCLYGDEYLTVDSDYPHYQCYEDGEVRLNHGGSLIKCIGENIAGTPISKWCPIHFEWDESAGVGGECRITNDPDRCDLGTMYDVDLPDDTPWQSNCSENMTAWDIRSNYSTEYQCLRPKAASPDPPDMGPYPKHAACCKDFSVSNYDDTLNPYRHYGFFLIKDVTII
ncbi:MAG: hypothetical protein KKG59_02660, partial [Nanoarchaeota archaeon]|nr:hypothetical protein [Nanoarchaeota archaeon]